MVILIELYHHVLQLMSCMSIDLNLCLYLAVCVDSRYSSSLKYGHLNNFTGHLAWHGLLAGCLLHKTHPEVHPLPISYTDKRWLPQTRFIQCSITAEYDVLAVVLVVVWQIKLNYT